MNLNKDYVICEICGTSFYTSSEIEICASCLTRFEKSDKKKAPINPVLKANRDIAKGFGGRKNLEKGKTRIDVYIELGIKFQIPAIICWLKPVNSKTPKKNTNSQTAHSKALRGATAHATKKRQIEEGTHKTFREKHMKAEVHQQLQTAWEESGLQWDDFVVHILSKLR